MENTYTTTQQVLDLMPAPVVIQLDLHGMLTKFWLRILL